MTTHNLPASLDHLRTGLQNTHARVKANTGGDAQFLRLQKSGIYTYGAEDIDVEQGSLWAVDPNSFMHGYIAWQPDDNKPAEVLGEEMRPATDPPVDKMALPDVGGPWDEQLGVTFLCINGEDKGTKVTFNTTSKGGIRAVNDLLGALVQRLQGGESDKIIPIVSLKSDSYKHKKYGQVFFPIFEITEWGSLSETPAEAKERVEHEPDPEPAPEPAPEAPTPDAPQGGRRRRRRVH